jgi:cell division septation protein DedD
VEGPSIEDIAVGRAPAQSPLEYGEEEEHREEPPACDRVAQQLPPQASAAPALAAPSTGGTSAGIVFRLRAKLAEWLLGGRWTAKLERRIEVKFSTVLGFAMAAVTTVFVILIYLQTPSKVDPRFASLDSSDGGAWRAHEASTGTQEREELPGARAEPSEGRLLPIWSPSSSPTAAQGALEGRPSEVRSVEKAPAQLEPTPAPTGVAVSQRASDAAALSPYVYLIQVRAKESAEGAQRIIEYLREFGFQENLVQTDPRGDRNAEGQLLHTVFVGKYFDRDEAERESDRLKRETRLRPYKGKEGFFQDALVITRRRG